MKLAILTVCFNSQETIGETLASIQEQSIRPDFFLIVDGKSDDDTLSIVDNYKGLVDRIISEQDTGIYDAMNKGVRFLLDSLDPKENWYLWIVNSDDLLYSPSSIHRIKALDRIYSTDCYFFSIEQFSENYSRLWYAANDRVKALRGYSCPHPGCVASLKLYRELGLFDDKWLISADLEWMHKVFLNDSYKLYFGNEVITRMRIGGISTKGLKSKLISTVELFRINNKLKLPVFGFISIRVANSMLKRISKKKKI